MKILEGIVCALCGVSITDSNSTKEHLIPNSIGGRKTVSDFICNSCNNIAGQEWDSELAKQLNPWALFFCINRERGEVPSQVFETIESDGRKGKIKLNADGSKERPIPECHDNGNGQVSVSANSIKAAKQMLVGLKRKKYPNIDVDGSLKNAKQETHYPNHIVKLLDGSSIGGEKAGRSIVKSALALAVMSGIDFRICHNACNYLKNENSEQNFGFYYKHDLVKNRPDGLVFHCVAVCGNPKTKQLLGYVEYYGFYRMVICLSDSYSGKEFNHCYAINPILNEELNLDISLSLTNEEILAVYRERFPIDRFKEALDPVISNWLKKKREQELNEAISQAFEDAWINCGAKKDEILTVVQIEKIVGETFFNREK